MKNSKINILLLFYLFVILVIANKASIIIVLGFLTVGMLFLPFILLIHALEKLRDAAVKHIPLASTIRSSPVDSAYQCYKEEYREDCGRICFDNTIEGINFSTDDFFESATDFSTDFPTFTDNSSDIFGDSFSSSSSLSDDFFYNPIYSDMECNIYHHDD